MGQFLRHAPCEACGSSDAKAEYDNGTAFCFKCGKSYGSTSGPREFTENENSSKGDLVIGEYMALPKRGIHVQTCQKYGYSCQPGKQIANYYQGPNLVAQKIRHPDHTFTWLGSARAAGLFGQQLWAAGGKRICITEGEIDALSLAQVQNLSWPVVSIKNGAQGAKKELAQHIEYLESFDEIVLMFDMDDPGRKAAAECAELFTPGKCKIGSLPLKDANEMLQAGRVRELVSAVWQARGYKPDGLIEGAELWRDVIAKPEVGLAYPWPCLDRLLYGQRARELVCWTGGTGLGKTQLLREVAFQLTQQHRQRLGYISLEESPRTLAIGQMALQLGKRLNLPPVEAAISEQEKRAAFDATLGTGRYLICDPSWVKPDEILSRIRYMVLGLGCQWVIFDHISLTVGGDASEGDERKRIDELMYKLRSLVDELAFGFHFVTHLRRKNGTPYEEGGRVSLADFRGSGAIAQVANIAIAMERDGQAEHEADKHRLGLRVLKNRFSGHLGMAGELSFNTETGRIAEWIQPVADPAPTEAPDF